MTTINITGTILSGNLGEGWSDQDEAAEAYAEFLSARYRAAAESSFPGAEISVEIEVEYNTEGCSPDAIATGDAGTLEMARLEDMLTNDGAWNEFLDSDAARELA
ncbi:hypothetical protein [Endozoicomonas sp. 4G]|uniref:hypothetical protein n=1 Tax=Endozoicomonas sp. 4G TaxID=2872754 RepID=UPI002078AA17|nr:hypothetical protein [Endozoicomonas sp. 4G]